MTHVDEPADGHDVPWRTLEKALQELDEFLGAATGDEAAFLQEHKAHLLSCKDRANGFLQ